MLVLFQTRLLVVVFTVYFTLISSFLLRFYLYILCSLYCVFLHSLLYLHLCTHLCFSVTSVLCPIIRRGLFFLFILSCFDICFLHISHCFLSFLLYTYLSSFFSCTFLPFSPVVSFCYFSALVSSALFLTFFIFFVIILFSSFVFHA